MTLGLQMVSHLDLYHVLYEHMAALRARDLFASSLTQIRLGGQKEHPQYVYAYRICVW